MPNKLRPDYDVTCRAIAQYLMDKLNAAYQAIQTELTFRYDSDTPVVKSIREHNFYINTCQDFPLLTCYRTGSSGANLMTSNAAIGYYLPSLADIERCPGIFRWVESQIARLLPVFDPCGEFGLTGWNAAAMTSQYPLIWQPFGGNSAFPFLQIKFQFREIGI